MKPQIEALFAKIDALSLRERIFLVLSVIACTVALVDAVWMSPALAANKKMNQLFASQSAELARLREELRTVATPVDPSKAVRADIAAANQQIDALNREVEGLLPHAKNGPALEQVLVQFLRKQEGLTLLGVRTLGSQVGARAAGTPAQAAGASALPEGLVKSGLELRVTGRYAELVRYVQTLETALPSLRWGSLQLKSEVQPPVLTLQVYVLGVQPS